VRDLQDRFPNARLVGGDKEYESMVGRVIGFVEAPQIGLNLPLDVRGTAFQRRVWQALQAIPVGQTSSYSDIAGVATLTFLAVPPRVLRRNVRVKATLES
jgi:AraC family transcriptional regulator, regulatory protein of adaptative response / methylated-DNA-[protein]-cysteine methyltransferase